MSTIKQSDIVIVEIKEKKEIIIKRSIRKEINIRLNKNSKLTIIKIKIVK